MRAPCRNCFKEIEAQTLVCPICGTARLFSPEQYEMLKNCSVQHNVSEWNEWRQSAIIDSVNGSSLSILLEAADLSGFTLSGVDLGYSEMEWSNLDSGDFSDANFTGAHLDNAFLKNTCFRRAVFIDAEMVGVCLDYADIRDTDFGDANIKSADLNGSRIEGATFESAIVDSETQLWTKHCDRLTDFTGVALGSMRIEPRLRMKLEGNIRRGHWQDWYKMHPYLSWPARIFWLMSDYGQSTIRIIISFCANTVIFGVIYYLYPWLIKDSGGIESSSLLRFVRSIYFSIVTMTTLGFGDIHANPTSILSHIVLSLHVCIGYILLGVIIIRFSILFQGVAVPVSRPVANNLGRPVCEICGSLLDSQMKCTKCSRK